MFWFDACIAHNQQKYNMNGAFASIRYIQFEREAIAMRFFFIYIDYSIK